MYTNIRIVFLYQIARAFQQATQRDLVITDTASGKMADQLAIGDDTASAMDALELQQAMLLPVPTSAPVTHGVLATAHVGQVSIMTVPSLSLIHI